MTRPPSFADYLACGLIAALAIIGTITVAAALIGWAGFGKGGQIAAAALVSCAAWCAFTAWCEA